MSQLVVVWDLLPQDLRGDGISVRYKPCSGLISMPLQIKSSKCGRGESNTPLTMCSPDHIRSEPEVGERRRGLRRDGFPTMYRMLIEDARCVHNVILFVVRVDDTRCLGGSRWDCAFAIRWMPVRLTTPASSEELTTDNRASGLDSHDACTRRISLSVISVHVEIGMQAGSQQCSAGYLYNYN